LLHDLRDGHSYQKLTARSQGGRLQYRQRHHSLGDRRGRKGLDRNGSIGRGHVAALQARRMAGAAQM